MQGGERRETPAALSRVLDRTYRGRGPADPIGWEWLGRLTHLHPPPASSLSSELEPAQQGTHHGSPQGWGAAIWGASPSSHASVSRDCFVWSTWCVGGEGIF